MLRRVIFEFTGTSPLLMSNPQGMKADTGASTTPKSKKRDKQKELEIACYRNKAGNFCFPTSAFRGALLKACKGRKIGKSAMEPIMAGAVLDVGDHLSAANLVHPKTGKPIDKYKVNETRAVNKNAGAIIVYRPQIDEWQCTVEFDVDDDFVPDLSVLMELFIYSGKMVGIGAWRVERKGKFGRFEVRLVSWDKHSVHWGKGGRKAVEKKARKKRAA